MNLSTEVRSIKDMVYYTQYKVLLTTACLIYKINPMVRQAYFFLFRVVQRYWGHLTF